MIFEQTAKEIILEGISKGNPGITTWLIIFCTALLIFAILGAIVHAIFGSEIHIKLWTFEFRIKERKK